MPLGLGLCGNCCTPTVCGTMTAAIVGCDLAANPAYRYPGAILTVKQGTTVIGSAAAINQVSFITRTATGSGYTSVPTATISGNGTGATAVAVLNTVSVTAVILTSGGSGYTTAPPVTITGTSTPGSDAAATSRLNPSAVASLTLATGGSGYADGTGYALGFSGGGGSGAAGTFNVVGGVVNVVTLTAGGANYTTAPALTFTVADTGSGFGATGTGGLTPGPVAGLTLTGGGSGYTPSGATLTIGAPPAGGTTATGTATVGTFSVTSFTVTNPGTGYTTATLAVTGGGGSGAAGTVTCRSKATVPLPAVGTYTPVISGAADSRGIRFVTQTLANQTLAACNGSTIALGGGATPINLLANTASYHCSGVPGCGPFPNNLFLTDANGTHTISWTSSGWTGNYTVSLPNTLLSASGNCGTGNVFVYYKISAGGTNADGVVWTLLVSWVPPSCCPDGSIADFSDSTNSFSASETFSIVTASMVCQTSLSLSWTLPTTKSTIISCGFGGGPPSHNKILPVSGTVTVTE